jgi:hypothetical protein
MPGLTPDLGLVEGGRRARLHRRRQRQAGTLLLGAGSLLTALLLSPMAFAQAAPPPVPASAAATAATAEPPAPADSHPAERPAALQDRETPSPEAAAASAAGETAPLPATPLAQAPTPGGTGTDDASRGNDGTGDDHQAATTTSSLALYEPRRPRAIIPEDSEQPQGGAHPTPGDANLSSAAEAADPATHGPGASHEPPVPASQPATWATLVDVSGSGGWGNPGLWPRPPGTGKLGGIAPTPEELTRP